MAAPWSARQVEEALAQPTTRWLTWPEAKGEPLGLVLGRAVDRDLFEIDLVAVAPRHRRQGIARGLLEALLRREQGVGIREFRLELAASNAPAAALYAALGFVVQGRRERYYPDGDDALLLSWHAPSEE